MRVSHALYGGEVSAHHYFRDFAYCDSGMIPWLLIWELLSKGGKTLGGLLEDRRTRFPSSGEINFKVANTTACIEAIEKYYVPHAHVVDHLDGLSVSFESWRFNVRISNTEPLLRLNLETRGDNELLIKKVGELRKLIEGFAQ